jgi:hypothetical protein
MSDKLTGLAPTLMNEIDREGNGATKMKVLRIVKCGQVIYSKEYTRMVKRNAQVVLFDDGKVGEIEFFVWVKESGVTFAVFKEILLDEDNPFFFKDAGQNETHKVDYKNIKL